MELRLPRSIQRPPHFFLVLPLWTSSTTTSKPLLRRRRSFQASRTCLGPHISTNKIRRHRAQDRTDNPDSKPKALFLISICDPPLVPPMTSAHRYPQHPPNPPKLPSLRDLNFYRPSGGQAALPPSQQPEQPVLQPEQPPQPNRHQVAWSRSPANPYASSSSAAAAAHQYAPQLSSGHEVTPKVEFPQKHENTGYAHPGMPLSAQTNPVLGSVNSGPSRADDASHSPNQPKKQRTAPTTASRDARGSHVRFFCASNFTDDKTLF